MHTSPLLCDISTHFCTVYVFFDPSWRFGLTGFHFSVKQSDLTASLSSEAEGWNRQKTPHQQADRRAGRSPDKNANISAMHPCYDRLTRPSEKPLQILAHTKRSMYTHTQTWWCIIKVKSVKFLFQCCCFFDYVYTFHYHSKCVIPVLIPNARLFLEV